MSKLLKIAMGVAVISSFVVGAAFAGQNAAAIGKLGWIDGTTNKFKVSRDEVSCTPKLGMAITGLSRLRGCDIQLYVNGVGGVLPPSWQYDLGGPGCAAGTQTAVVGYKTNGAAAAVDSVYNAWVQAPGVPGVAVGQGGAMYYNQGSCLSPHGVGMLWFAAAGTGGVARNPAKTFGLYSVILDQNSGCPGDCSDPHAVCINVQFRQPCADAGNPRGPVYAVTDATNTFDYVTVPQPFVTWNGQGMDCPGVTKSATGSWGTLKKTYR